MKLCILGFLFLQVLVSCGPKLTLTNAGSVSSSVSFNTATTLDLGVLVVNQESTERTLQIVNTESGNAINNCEAATLSGSNASEFSLTDTCPPSILPGALNACSLKIIARPTTVGSKTVLITKQCREDTLNVEVMVDAITDFSTFSLTGDSAYSANYTSSAVVTLNFTGDADATNYCWQESSDSTTCSWQSSVTSGTSVYTFASASNEVKTVYLFKKDDYGYSTNGKNTSITFDNSNPSTMSLTDPVSWFSNGAAVTISYSGGTDDNFYFYQGRACTNAACSIGCLSDSSSSSASGSFTYSGLSETAYYFCLRSFDLAGNSNSYGVTSAALTVDLTAPVITFTSAPTALAQNATFDLEWTITEQNAASGSTMGIYFYNGSAWSSVHDSTTAAGPLAATAYSYEVTAPAINTSSAKYRIVYSDQASNVSTTDTSSFIIDGSTPSVDTLTLNGGAGSTYSNIVTVALTSSDDLSNITHLCVQYDSSDTPVSSDSCWITVDSAQVGVTPASSITVNNYAFMLGLSAKSYSVFAFTKNASGLISSLSSAGEGTTGVDKNSITYAPENPPVINNVIATDNDSPTNPLTSAELTIGGAESVYIKWNASDVEGLAATPVAIYYTTDDVNYTLVANNLNNGINSACTADDAGSTLDDGNTGCYVWNTPNIATYFKIRVGVTDDKNYTSFNSSLPLNTPDLSFIAGKTDTGIGGVASSAIFTHDLTYSLHADTMSFVRTRAGIFYFRDPSQGLLKIDPTTNVVTRMMPITGTQSGDGGPYTSATLGQAIKITLDASDNLLIFDQDRIRYLDLQTGNINTIIGGGNDNSNTIANPLNVDILDTTGNSSVMQHFLLALPNGDIYFTSSPFNSVNNREARAEGGWKLRKYSASTGQITSILPHGTDFLPSAMDAEDCYIAQVGIDYDKETSAINYIFLNMHQQGVMTCVNGFGRIDESGNTIDTANVAGGGALDWRFYYVTNNRDGKLMLVHHYNGTVHLLDKDTPALSTIYGSGSSGICADGTLATACQAFVHDAFRNETGETFISENGVIRLIDNSGKVQTLYGQRKNYGDGGLATNARFGTITSIQKGDSGNIYALDLDTKYIRKFIRGGNISVAVGDGSFESVTNGVAVTSNGLDVGTWWINDYFILTPVDEKLFYGAYNNIYYYDATADNLWHTFIGGFVTDFHDGAADGQVGTNLAMRLPTPLGYDSSDDRILTLPHDADFAPTVAPMAKSYDISTGIQHAVAGINTTNALDFSMCADGTAVSACDISWSTQSGYIVASHFDISDDSVTKRWFIHANVGNYNSNEKIYILNEGGTKETLLTAPRAFKAFTYHRFSGPSKEIVWYCDNTNKRIYQYNITDSIETALEWPISSMECQGYNIIFDPDNNSLIFPYLLNGISGIAEHRGIYPAL